MNALVCALLALALLSPAACSLPRETAAEVNGKPIATAELEQELARLASPSGGLGPGGEKALPRLRRLVLERLVDRELMLQEAGARGLLPSAAAVEEALARARESLPERDLDAVLAEAGTDRERWRQVVARDLAIEALQREVTAGAAVGEEEIDAYLARHRDAAGGRDETHASQILLRTREEALEARRRIVGGAPFAQVAREVSLAPEGERGGDLGWFPPGVMPPEFDAALSGLEEGKLSEVVETAYGHHLFLVTGRRPARARDLAERRREAREALLGRAREERFRAWLRELRGKARIRYNTRIAPGA